MWSETTLNSSSIICIYRVFYLVCKSINYAQMLNCKTCQKLLTSTPPPTPSQNLANWDHVYFVHSLTDLLVNILTDTQPMYRSTYQPHSTDMSVNKQGSKKNPSGRLGQVDFPFGPVTFSPSLPDGQVSRQGVRRFNFC